MEKIVKHKIKYFTNLRYKIKHKFQKNKGICPRCGTISFDHGFEPRMSYYCRKCGLWTNEEKENV